MRIGEVARLAGVSARSIRHYHRLGVLVEPPRSPGRYREYDVSDLVRIARIAFPSSSGVPLRDVPALLDADAATDLDALRRDIDERIEALTRQRARLDAIAERADAGLPIGLLPESVSRALDACRSDAADDPSLAALVDRERDLLDLLALSAAVPDALAESYAAIGADAGRRARYLDLLRGFRDIEGRPVASVEPRIAALVHTLSSDPALQQIVGTPPPDEHSGPGPTLEQLLPDPAQREVIRRVLDRLSAVSVDR